MRNRLALLGLVCMALSSCVEPAGYWADLCGRVGKGEEVVPAGKARVERAVVLDLRDTAVMWPNMARYPLCAFPVALEFADDVELNEFDKLKLGGPGALGPVSLSGWGEWRRVQWGDAGDSKVLGFVIASPKVEGPAEISDDARKTQIFMRTAM